MPGALLEVERLINRPVQVEHEVDAQPAVILQGLEALAAGAAGIEVDDKLIHHLLQGRQVPAAAPHALDLGVGQASSAQVVAVGGSQVGISSLDALPA